MKPSNPLETLLGITPDSTPSTMSGTANQLANSSHPPKAAPAFSMVDTTTGEFVERKTEGFSDENLDREERVEDIFIDAQLQEVHQAAMAAFYAQHALSQGVDPKFSARNAEVAAQYLGTALSTIQSRVDAKHKRQVVRQNKVKLGQTEKNSISNNIIFADRNTLLKQLLSDPTLLPGDPNTFNP